MTDVWSDIWFAVWVDLWIQMNKMTWSQWAISILFLACCAVTWVGTWLTLVTHQAQQERHRREYAELVKARQWLDGPPPRTDPPIGRHHAVHPDQLRGPA